MKALFLDFDGVLNRSGVRVNPPNWATSWPFQWIEGNLVTRLEPIFHAHPETQLVISSTWRRHWLPSELRRILSDHSAIVGRRVAGVTPEVEENPLHMRQFRGDEIQFWLDGHPYIRSFAILDDDADMLDSQKPFLVQTDPMKGITESNVDSVIRIFNQARKETVK